MEFNFSWGLVRALSRLSEWDGRVKRCDGSELSSVAKELRECMGSYDPGCNVVKRTISSSDSFVDFPTNSLSLYCLKIHQVLSTILACPAEPSSPFPGRDSPKATETDSNPFLCTTNSIETKCLHHYLNLLIDFNAPAEETHSPSPSPFTVCVMPKAWSSSNPTFERCFLENAGRLQLIVDEEYLNLAVENHGRFDFYLSAVLFKILHNWQVSEGGQDRASLVQKPVEGEVRTDGPQTTPDQAASEAGSTAPQSPTYSNPVLQLSPVLPKDLLLNRAAHAIRVFDDATTSFICNEVKYQWYTTLLTSGSLRAVQDTFHDLANETWHAQFSRAIDRHSVKRLEKLLVALLGHSNALVRSQAVVFLNNLYDWHDWQQDLPFLPIVKCVGEEFSVEIVIKHDADERLGQHPEDHFLILCAPCFGWDIERTGLAPRPTFSEDGGLRKEIGTDGKILESTPGWQVYSYHSLSWSPWKQHAGAEKYRRFISSSGGGKHIWVGKIDFGRFKRCGFYDWRVVRLDEQSGSWEVVQSSVGGLKEHLEDGYSFLQLGSRPQSHVLHSSSSSTVPGTLVRKAVWPELGRFTEASDEMLNIGLTGQPAGGAAPCLIPLQGRFIVHAAQSRREQIHQVVVDQVCAVFDADTGRMTQRGSFSKVANALSGFKRDGVTSVALTGALARDNGKVIQSGHALQAGLPFERPDSSPFAITCRASPCAILGGSRGFSELVREANRLSMRLIVEAVSRVSSSRPHRKYRPYMLHSVDENGRRRLFFGSDGRGIDFEESCLLNYRRAETWDLMVEDCKNWILRFGVQGIRIENCHLIPQILPADEEELSRLDCDGRPHYSPEERLCGDLVSPVRASTELATPGATSTTSNLMGSAATLLSRQTSFSENGHTWDATGYWNSPAALDAHWPNPFLVKFCKELWAVCPDLLVIGECGAVISSEDQLEKRLGIIAKSGAVPEIHSLPETLAPLFNKAMDKDTGEIHESHQKVPQSACKALSSWYSRTHQAMPEGGISILSSCSVSSPLPALLYGRGAWPAVDLLFFGRDVPLTLMGEIEGKSFRLDVAEVFRVDQKCSTKLISRLTPGMASARSLLALQGSPLTPASRLFSKARSLAKFEPVESLATLEEEQVKAVGPESGFDLHEIYAHYKHRRAIRSRHPIFQDGSLLPLQLAPGQDDLGLVFPFCRINMETSEMIVICVNFGDCPIAAGPKPPENSPAPVQSCEVSMRWLTSHFHTKGLPASTMVESFDLFEMDGLLVAELAVEGADEQSVNRKLSDLFSSKKSLSIEALGSNRRALIEEKISLMTLSELLSGTVTLPIVPFGSTVTAFKLLDPEPMKLAEANLALYASSLCRLRRLIKTCNVGKKAETKSLTGGTADVLSSPLMSNFVFASLYDTAQIQGDATPFAQVLRYIHGAMEWIKEDPSSLNKWLRESDILTQDRTLANKFFGKLRFISQQATQMSLSASPKAASQGLQLDGLGKLCEYLCKSNEMGSIVFMTPELGKWSSVGGLGVMVDELSSTLSRDLHQNVTVVSPYYEVNGKGERDYMRKDGIRYLTNISILVPFGHDETPDWRDCTDRSERIELGVHYGVINGVKLFFLHNTEFFPYPYPDFNPYKLSKMLVVLSLSFLELLCQVNTTKFREAILALDSDAKCEVAAVSSLSASVGGSSVSAVGSKSVWDPEEDGAPSLIVTNDWSTGLISAYGRNSDYFGDYFLNKTKFFHIIHNFDESYEGRIYPHTVLTGHNDPRLNFYLNVFKLNKHYLIDELWSQIIINPSRCALLNSQQWGTVSNSYKADLIKNSPLNYLLKQFQDPFSTPNGIPIKIRKAKLNSTLKDIKAANGGVSTPKASAPSLSLPAFGVSTGLRQADAGDTISIEDHWIAKGFVQKKYFGFQSEDLKIPLFSFIGRITSQKGVHLILESTESLIRRYNSKIQILIGGKVIWNDPYSARCGQLMNYLKGKYPYSFYASPNEFFTDGTLINIASDFALMPSLFEPGGIVQHEFFLAGTPVIAFKTGGLKDTVWEFDLENQTGNGFNFSAYNLGDFIYALERAYRLYQDSAKYKKLRDNAQSSVVSCEDCALNWLDEFARLRGKILLNSRAVAEEAACLQPLETAKFTEEPLSAVLQRLEKRFAVAESSQRKKVTTDPRKFVKVKYNPPSGRPRPRSVAISGSYDNWKARQPLVWDHPTQCFALTLTLLPGEYLYKFIVDGDWVTVSDRPIKLDSQQNRNNVLVVE